MKFFKNWAICSGSWGLSQKSDQTATSPDDSSDVTLVAFSPRQQSTRYKTRPTSLSRNSKSTQDITYSINGQVCTPSSEIVPSVVGNKVVTLVGFSPRNTSFKQPSGVRRSESFAPSSEKTKKKQNYKRDVDLDDEDQESSTGASTYYSPYCTNTLKTSKELKMERERVRQEKLSHFARDAQNWRRQAETSESKTSKSFDSGSNGFDDPFFAAFDKMMGSGAGSKTDDFMKFFQEAEKRFTTAGFKSRDAGFGKFFQENRERFNQMKEEMRKRREENVLKMSDFDDFFSKVTTDWKKSDPFFDAEEKLKSEWAPKDGYYDPPGAEDTSSTTRNESFRRSFSSSSGFDSCSEASGPKYNPRHTHFGGTFDFGSPEPLFRDRGGGFAPKFTTTFNGFTRFTPIIVSPPGNNRVVAGKMGYKMKTHRSTFEYDGNTNTYRFSTEQVTHSFNGDGSAVSESEESDDEDEDPPRNKSTLAALPSSTNVPHLQSSSTTAAKNASALLPSSSPAPLEKPCPSPAGGDAMAGSPVGGCQGDTLSVAAPSELDSCTEGGNSPNNSVAALEYSDPSQDKSHNIAMELLTTEKTYVDVLHLIDQVFYARVEEENEVKQMFPPEVLPQIFANVRSLYKFHHDFLLPKLKERMENWETDPRIGDIMKDFAPFLKMYAEYVKNFDHAMNLINVLVGKNPRFAAIVEEIQQMPECGNLTLQHHMLSPIQRLPRYQLLLQDYLRRLPDNSSDRDHTERALHLVSVAAMHANDAMRKMDQFKQLLEIQDRLGGVSTIDLVSPSRALVREGKVTKISARSGDHQERYLFLFTDLVLLCSTRPRLPVGSVAQYRLRAQFPMAGLQVLEGDNLETPNTFYLSDGQRTIELYTSSVEEKEAWVTSFVEVIQDLCLHKSSLRLDDSSTTAMGNGHNDDDSGDGSANGALVTSDESSGVGMNPPSLLRMDGVGKCMDCGASFTFKRKHHCHACGIIVCSKCSNQKAILKYNNSKESRICKECYRKLRNASLLTNSDGNAGSLSDGKMLASNGSTSTLTNGRDGYGIDGDYAALGRERVMLMGPRLLDVPANSPCTVNGYLNLKSVRGKTWAKRWFVLHAEGVLFSYKLPSDDRALTATPVPGYSLTHGHGLKGDPMVNEKERDLTFKMHCANKAYYFQAETKGDLLRWITELEECVRNNTTTN